MIYRNGAKMSKSKGNVVSPDDMIKIMEQMPLELTYYLWHPRKDAEWNDSGIEGTYRF